MRVPLEQYKKEMAEMITKAKAAGAIVILQATNTVYTTDNHAKSSPISSKRCVRWPKSMT